MGTTDNLIGLAGTAIAAGVAMKVMRFGFGQRRKPRRKRKVRHKK